MSLSAIPKTLRQRIFARDRGMCRYCRLIQIGQAAVFHINHIIPKSKGGPTEESNLALQCPYCSLHKSNKLNAADSTTGDLFELFHPLKQAWNEHFVLDNSGNCHGRTGVGRATIEALHMNDSLPRAARAIQIRLGMLSLTE